MFKRIRKRYTAWKNWCQFNTGSKIHQILVFLGFVESKGFNAKLEFDMVLERARNIINYYK